LVKAIGCQDTVMQQQTINLQSKGFLVVAGIALFVIDFLITLGARFFIAQYLPNEIQMLGVAKATIEVALKLCLTVIPILFILYLHHEPLRKFGISWGKTPFRHLTMGALIALLWFFLGFSALIFTFGSSVVTFIPLTNINWNVWLFWFVYLLTLNSLGEEVESRAYLQTVFSRVTGSRRGIVISAILFGIGHIPINFYIYHSTLMTTLYNVGDACLFGVVAGYLYAITGNILASISLHSVSDVINTSLPLQASIPNSASSATFIMLGLGDVIISFIILGLLILLHKYGSNYVRRSE
jgi:membrane protease YdiL (CAAX protease family)